MPVPSSSISKMKRDGRLSSLKDSGELTGILRGRILGI